MTTFDARALYSPCARRPRCGDAAVAGIRRRAGEGEDPHRHPHVDQRASLHAEEAGDPRRTSARRYEVEWVRFAGSGDAMPALVAGKLDACLATPFPMANALNQSRVPVTIVHQLLSFGFDGYYDDATVVRTDSGISKFADLKGKTFGVNAIGGTRRAGRAHHGAQGRASTRTRDLTDRRSAAAVPRRRWCATTRSRRPRCSSRSSRRRWPRATSRCCTRRATSTADPTDYVFMAFDDKFLKAQPASGARLHRGLPARRQLGARQPRRGGDDLRRAMEAAGAGRRQLPADQEGLPRAPRRQASAASTSSRWSTASRPMASSRVST